MIPCGRSRGDWKAGSLPGLAGSFCISSCNSALEVAGSGSPSGATRPEPNQCPMAKCQATSNDGGPWSPRCRSFLHCRPCFRPGWSTACPIPFPCPRSAAPARAHPLQIVSAVPSLLVEVSARLGVRPCRPRSHSRRPVSWLRGIKCPQTRLPELGALWGCTEHCLPLSTGIEGFSKDF